MSEQTEGKCKAAFHQFIRKQPWCKIDPDSPLYAMAEIAFINGFFEGGKYGSMITGKSILKDIKELGK